MAAQGTTTTTSRLTQMQMRFQQKQQQERDQKKGEMISSSKTTSRTISTFGDVNGEKINLNSSIGAGKVRQMFDERRHRVAGIDKSYPLQPIQTKVSLGVANNNNNNSVANGKSTRASHLNNKTRVPPISANSRSKTTTIHRYNDGDTTTTTTTSTIFSSNGNLVEHDDNDNMLENEKFPDSISLDDELLNNNHIITKKLPNVGKLSLNNNINEIGNINANVVKLKPVGMTPIKKIVKNSSPPITKSPGTRSTSSSASSNGKSSHSGSSVLKNREMSSVSTPTTKTRPPTVTKTAPRPISVSAVPDGLVSCPHCGRNFANDRIQKHKEICLKTKTKKRRTFDVVKHRVQGTDAEKYVNKKVKPVVKSKAVSVAAAPEVKKSDWRRKHEEFINAIRAAKEMKAFLAKGGKLSDLPPPPPSENPDYIQCPHCSRKFNQTAAERHIPKCANMLHNKPKPKAAAVKKRF